MSFNNLRKEQKQYIVLGALAAVILITLLILGVRFSLSSIKDSKIELGILTGKIESADRTLSSRDEVSADFQNTMQSLKKQIMGTPPERNYYSWATEVIYSLARTTGLEINSIDEIGSTRRPVKKNSGDDIRLEAYALRINALGGYNSVKAFINWMKKEYPLVRFTGLEIASGKSPDTHKVQIWLQWPFNLNVLADSWDSVEAQQRALELAEADEGTASKLQENKDISDSMANEDEVAAVPEVTTEPKAEVSVNQQPKSEPTPPAPRPVAEPEVEIQVVPEPKESHAKNESVVPLSVETDASMKTESPSSPPEMESVTTQLPEDPETVAVMPVDLEPDVGSIAEPDNKAVAGTPEQAALNQPEQKSVPEEPESQPSIGPEQAQLEPEEPVTAESLSLSESDDPELESNTSPEAEQDDQEEPLNPMDTDSQPEESIMDQQEDGGSESSDDLDAMLEALQEPPEMEEEDSPPEPESEEASIDEVLEALMNDDSNSNATESDLENPSSEQDFMKGSTEDSTRELASPQMNQNEAESNESIDSLLESLIGEQS